MNIKIYFVSDLFHMSFPGNMALNRNGNFPEIFAINVIIQL